MPPRGRGKGRGRGAASASAEGDDNNTESPAPETSSPPPKKESGATVAFANVKRQAGCRDILVDKLDISFHGKNLLENASLQLYCGHRYGLVGANGCGKTTLMNVLGLGEVPLPEQVDYFHLTKEVQASDKSALEVVLEADTEKILLEKELEELALADQDDDAVTRRMDEIYARLDELEADTAESRAAKILFGLGFTAAMQARPTNSFSGGWRMRISLAQALFKNPTFLLLDEPTNHLDIEAVVWLEKHLEKFDKILFLVSHSQDFLNAVCTNIIHMTRGRLINYEGNYDQYVITRSEKDVHQMKRFSWQQNQIKSMKEYIARFGRGHKKLARQAQSKEKTLQKMERGGLESAVARDREVTFLFPCGGYLPPPILQFTEVSFNYPNRPPLFTNLELGLDLDSRICLVGPNGAGKTTLTKLMCRELEPTSGYVAKNAHCTIARFHQHFVDQINMDLSPLEWMSQEFPEVIQPQPFRQALGRMGVSGPLQMAPMKTLSDGQKSRCVFAWMAFKQPHFLILDEPTNHLDIESIDALADAITEFEGAVVVVSHDLRLIAQVADEIWIVDEGSARRFQGDIADYKEFVQEQIARMERDFVKNRGQQKASSGAR